MPSLAVVGIGNLFADRSDRAERRNRDIELKPTRSRSHASEQASNRTEQHIEFTFL